MLGDWKGGKIGEEWKKEEPESSKRQLEPCGKLGKGQTSTMRGIRWSRDGGAAGVGRRWRCCSSSSCSMLSSWDLRLCLETELFTSTVALRPFYRLHFSVEMLHNLHIHNGDFFFNTSDSLWCSFTGLIFLVISSLCLYPLTIGFYSKTDLAIYNRDLSLMNVNSKSEIVR